MGQKINPTQIDGVIDVSDQFTLSPGWSANGFAAYRVGDLVTITGYFAKGSSISHGDLIGTFPEELRPVNIYQYGFCHGGATDKTGRVLYNTDAGGLAIYNPSASMVNAVFSLTWSRSTPSGV